MAPLAVRQQEGIANTRIKQCHTEQQNSDSFPA